MRRWLGSHAIFSRSHSSDPQYTNFNSVTVWFEIALLEDVPCWT
jgi:hypothetical protein